MLACLSPNGTMSFKGDGACDRLLVGTAEGIAVLERRGDAWQRTGSALAGQHIAALLHEPTLGGLFAGVHRGTIHFSADGGRTWEERARGLTISHVYTLACQNEGGKPVIYAGTEPVSLFRSDDYGASWHERPLLGKVTGTEKWAFPMPPNVPHVKTIALDPRDARRLLVGVEQGGLFESRDGGESWRELDGYYRTDDEVYKDMHQLLRRPGHPEQVFMATGNGFYFSPDDGANWEMLTDRRFRIGYPDKLVFSPRNDARLVLCGAVDHPGTWRVNHYAHPAVMVSDDLGRTWQRATRGMPEDMVPSIEALTVCAAGEGVELFAGTTDGAVWHSGDEAGSWQRVCEGLGPVSKAAHFRLLLPGGPGGPGAPAGGPPPGVRP